MNSAETYNLYVAAVSKARSHRAKATNNARIQLGEGRFSDSASINRDLFYFAGRWLCSGLLRPSREPDNQDQYDLLVSIWIGMEKQRAELISAIVNISDKLADYLCCKPTPYGEEILFHAPVLDEWLDKYFRHSDRFLPDWVYDLPEPIRRALLDGLIDGSTPYFIPTCKFSVIGKQHASEVKKLAETLGYTPTMHAGLPADPACHDTHYSGIEPFYTIDLHASICRNDKFDI